mgnify:FL=1
MEFTGCLQIWISQNSIEKSTIAITLTINDTPHEDATTENIGRFTLYPTANRFNYILLDQFTVKTWQI